MRPLKKAAVIAALGLAVTAGTASAANATSYQTSTSWGGHTRTEVIFDNSGDETYFVRDAYTDSYGAYATWWGGAKSGACNDTNGSGTTYKACGPLSIGEGKAFDTNICSKDYDGSTLVDSKCSGRFRLGTT